MISSSILEPRERVGAIFNDINGFSEKRIFAVGNRGEIFFFDGSLWASIASPTNVHLESISLIDNSVYIVGRSGVILVGDENGFMNLDFDDRENYWDVSIFKEKIYVSSSSGVSVLEGDREKESFFPSHSGYKLTANDTQLISIGSKKIFIFDGKDQKELICPDNE